tara:strand:- start:338 stop:601 length:264 start_codon:yes stop_codon:yes gene_type:complete
MFKNFFKKTYKSKKTLESEKAKQLEIEIDSLRKDNLKRQKQISKFLTLMEIDPEHEKRYQDRIDVHKKFMTSNNKRIEEIEYILLDK